MILWISLAFADPVTFVYQGRLLDPAGGAVEGTHTVDVAVYDDVGAIAPVWSEGHELAFASGYFHVTLGTTTPIDGSAWPARPWVGLSVDGVELSRQAMTTVPFAQRATHVEGGAAHVTELTVAGVLVVDDQGRFAANVPWDQLTGRPALATPADVSSAVAAHATNPNAHHTRYTDAEARAAVPTAGNETCPSGWLAYGDLCFYDSRRAENDGTIGDHWCRSELGGHLCTSFEIVGIRGWRGWFGGNFWYADQYGDDGGLSHNTNGGGYWYNHDGGANLADHRAAYCCRSR